MGLIFRNILYCTTPNLQNPMNLMSPVVSMPAVWPPAIEFTNGHLIVFSKKDSPMPENLVGWILKSK